MPKLKLNNKEIQKLLDTPPPEFPKYTSLLLNFANRTSQATRPKVVGKVTELIKEFPGRKLNEWEEWYVKTHPNAISSATQKIVAMISEWKDATQKIDKKLVERWVWDLVIVKTFIGLRFQEAILKKVAELKNEPYKLASSAEESKGIDGYVGNQPVSIKPSTYKSMRGLSEKIDVPIIYYSKRKDGIEIEFD